MKPCQLPYLLLSLTGGLSLSADLTEEARWLESHQQYDLVLNPETIGTMTDHPFVTYMQDGVQRLVISDRDDGLWRVEPDGILFQSTGPEQPLGSLEGDQHTLSFFNVQNVLIERLDLYAHEVEEALKFSACANVVVRDCRLVAASASEDAADIVRGQNYIFDRTWFVGLGDREMTIKGSARYIDIVDCRFGLRTAEDFREVFNSEMVMIGADTFMAGDFLMPRETVPSWIYPCLIFSSDRSLGIEIGGWSDYDIGYLNEDNEIEERPPTSDIRIQSTFAHDMDESCDKESDMVAVLQWHTAERVEANTWIFRPTETDIIGDIIEELYYEESRPSAEEEAALRESLGDELDYYGVELPRYQLHPGESGSNRFFGSLYNADNTHYHSPFSGWMQPVEPGPAGHDFPQPGEWIFHFNADAFLTPVHGAILPVSYWWNGTEASWQTGQFLSTEP